MNESPEENFCLCVCMKEIGRWRQMSYQFSSQYLFDMFSPYPSIWQVIEPSDIVLSFDCKRRRRKKKKKSRFSLTMFFSEWQRNSDWINTNLLSMNVVVFRHPFFSSSSCASRDKMQIESIVNVSYRSEKKKKNRRRLLFCFHRCQLSLNESEDDLFAENKRMPRCIFLLFLFFILFVYMKRCLSSDDWKWEIQKKINNHYLLLIVADSMADVLVSLRPKHRLRWSLSSSSDQVSSFRWWIVFFILFLVFLSSRSNRLY